MYRKPSAPPLPIRRRARSSKMARGSRCGPRSLVSTASRISSLLQKPDSNGKAGERQRAAQKRPMSMWQQALRRPPKRLMSMTLPIACMTLPALEGIAAALKKACVTKCDIAAAMARSSTCSPGRLPSGIHGRAERQEHIPQLTKTSSMPRRLAKSFCVSTIEAPRRSRRGSRRWRQPSTWAAATARTTAYSVRRGRRRPSPSWRRESSRSDRGRAFHRVEQPDVQRELRRFARRRWG